MPSKKAESQNPMYPEAHPTAPGGMSQQGLVDELLTVHGWSNSDVAKWRKSPRSKSWILLSWNEMIDAVAQERLNREREAKAQAVAQLTAERHGADVFSADTSTDDLDALLDEIEGTDTNEYAWSAEVEEAGTLFIGMPDSYDYVFDGHAGMSPSGAERWMHCTASLQASREFLETLTLEQQQAFAGGSSAARQGTTAHAAGEIELGVLLGQITEEEAEAGLLELTINPEVEGEAYDEEMAAHVQIYVDLVKQYIDERGAENVLIEQRLAAAVPLANGEVHEINGSGDCVALPTDEHPDLVVVDYKHGEGIDVEVDENPQIRIYALGALARLVDDEGQLTRPVKTITYHIVQPRTTGIKTWSESLDDLLDWLDEELSPAASAALTGDGAEFAPEASVCQWCPAKGGCAALAEQRYEQGADLFNDLMDAEVSGEDVTASALSNERLGELLAQIDSLVDLRDEMRAEAQRRLLRGSTVPGYKLVNFSPPRCWSSEAAELLDDLPVWKPKQLLTPKQALAVVDEEDKAYVETMIHTPEKKPVLGTTNDRRSDWVDPASDPAALFPEMED